MSRPFTIRAKTQISAPIERVFRLSTCVAIVAEDLKMRPCSGCLDGCVRGGDTILWRGWKFCLPQTHESVIEAYDPPHFFRDRMVSGRFAEFEHDHAFEEVSGGVVELRDEVRFTMRWGWIGAWIGRLILEPHVRGLMMRRFERIKRLAEGDGWRTYLPDEQS